jgi:muramoyltetrapeptide carboxypeptidase
VASSGGSPALRKPRAIAPGATLGIAAPGGPVNPDRLAEGRERLRAAGYGTLCLDDVTARRGYLAGEDVRRAKELMELAQDPRVDAIVCARGGYGCDRILHLLDAPALRAAAKPIVGYSDVTALLLWLRRRAGLVGFHGPMLERGADADPAAQEALLAHLAGRSPLPLVLCGRGLVGGAARGRLVGGSLTLVAASLGTPWELQARGAILLLEEVNEAPYRVDRMLQQLRAAGKLAGLAGVGIGDVSTCVDERYETGVLDVIEEVVRPLGVPLVVELPFGHLRSNATWPVGVRAELDGERGELRVLEHGVQGPR